MSELQVSKGVVSLKSDATKAWSGDFHIDWATYPILRFPDAPRAEVDMINIPGKLSWGAGEPTATTIPVAIANAIYDAAGARIRSIPFTPEKVLAALKTSGGGAPGPGVGGFLGKESGRYRIHSD